MFGFNKSSLPTSFVAFTYRCSQVSDIGVGYLSTMTSLRRLFLRWCTQIRDFGLQHVYTMKSLQVLSLAGEKCVINSLLLPPLPFYLGSANRVFTLHVLWYFASSNCTPFCVLYLLYNITHFHRPCSHHYIFFSLSPHMA